MLKVKLNAVNPVEVSIPENAKEMTLNQACAFEAGFEDFVIYLKERDEEEITSYVGQLEYIDKLADLVCDTLDLKKSQLMGQHVGNLVEHFKVLKGKEGELDLGAAQHSLLWIFEQLRKAQGYMSDVPFEEDYIFEYKGEKFIVSGARVGMHGRGLILPDFTVGQVVEVMEAFRVMSDQEKQQKANARFTRRLTELAVLALKEGEKFPTRPKQLDQFISARVRHFAQINWKIAADVGFFLTRTIHNLRIKEVQSIFSTHQHPK